MRWIVASLVLLACGAMLHADVAPREGMPRPPLPGPKAAEFARHLEGIMVIVERWYVRPVLRSDLAASALTGLFEAARLPLPAPLAEELRKFRGRELALALGRALAEAGWPAPQPLAAEANDRIWNDQVEALNAQLFELSQRTRQQLGDHEGLRDQRGLIVSVQAMLKTLDPYSGLSTPEDAKRAGGTQTITGLEIEDYNGYGPLVVRTVIPGSPAQKAGLRPGDRITQINGTTVEGAAGAAGVALLKREVSDRNRVQLLLDERMPEEVLPDSIDLVFERGGAMAARRLRPESYLAETVFGVTRRDDNSWDYWLDRRQRIALVRLGFLSGTTKALAEAITELHKEGLRGLVLDLRWCPGGYLDDAVLAAQLFVGSSCVARVHYRAQPPREYRQAADRPHADFPVLVLVNAETSGGAELIAAALQDNGRALVAGQRTRGKGSVQMPLDQMIPLPNFPSIKLTTGSFIRPNGKNLHRFPDSKPSDDWGVRPDPGLEIRVSAELSQRLHAWCLLQALRPGTSREILPLDDPANDPQRQEALRILLERIQQRAGTPVLH